MGCHFLLQGIFWTQGSNLHLLYWQAGSLPLSHQGSSERRLQSSLVQKSLSLPTPEGLCFLRETVSSQLQYGTWNFMSRSADAFWTLVRKDVINFPKGRVSESLLMSCWYSFNFSEYEDLGVRVFLYQFRWPLPEAVTQYPCRARNLCCYFFKKSFGWIQCRCPELPSGTEQSWLFMVPILRGHFVILRVSFF